MELELLNALGRAEAEQALLQCCGSSRWAQAVTASRPYENVEVLITRANEIWWSLQPGDWLEAFRSHPKIGEKKAAAPISDKSRQWSGQEQSGVRQASQEIVDSLATLNRVYEEKFGFIFIICATGKTSQEMLAALRERLANDATRELTIAAAEQGKITELRLRKLLGLS
jgi:OHCU decarboxylase